ncbi:MAG: 16S rRNA (cytosine(1402)-N(4))-methyltransferase RsmH [Nitrospiraceae bacterium]|nr:16S rRNA (cytosine(1402)-N(4))-methyltransferase RsmH [Nitrospiraceae bacterium]
MVPEVLEGLSISPGGTYVDATLGMGGHTEAILLRCPDVKLVLGLDCDAEVLEQARSRLRPFGKKVQFVCSNFIHLPDLLCSEGIGQVDGIVMDLGLSSFQLEASERGFSFSREEPLDMRMDPSSTVTAANMVNRLPVNRLAEIIWEYGEERWAKRIARHIYERRRRSRILTSADLAGIIVHAIPRKYRSHRIHPATRTFQAIRIAVNRELDNLKAALESFSSCLEPEGRLCIISFHSLEDRMVKRAFREDTRLKILTKKPMTPNPDEIGINPRARSAKLRIAQCIDDISI